MSDVDTYEAARQRLTLNQRHLLGACEALAVCRTPLDVLAAQVASAFPPAPEDAVAVKRFLETYGEAN